MKSFAIVVVCYNRVKGVSLLVESLKRANYENRNDITLVFSIDYSGSNAVEEYAKSVDWKYGKKIIRTFPERQGLKNHILKCGEYTHEYDIVAVLEDDIIVSDSFYSYGYKAANYYWNDDNIAGISLYSFQKNWLKWILRFEPMKTEYDTFFIKVAQSWGQIWTRQKWDAFMEWYFDNLEFVYDEKLPSYLNNWPESSWLKFHDKYCIENNKYFVYPYYALSTNTSSVGEHSNIASNDYQVDMQYNKSDYFFQPFSDNSIKYDEYFCRENIYKFMDIEDEDLEVDLYGTKKIDKGKKFLLTAIKYKNIIPEKSFSLSMRPIEASIIYNMQGEGLYLYRMTNVNNYKRKLSNYELLKYELRSRDWRILLPFAVKNLIETVLRKIF